ncbi:MAG: alpha/beta fold hydrolase [Candidatus Abyssobacteria bacterium SURF_17]|uniref:Alpha/beta fold hydrolase n=1 Tax=Candidatus Abyssobacteria bacterium SURF_17 TaxID=2093361 RepID=A0A419F6C3_9BACT|nr:MAG: alpha/beta fold hydrolase [Candidatus Abyssubacteria bacterium SURF_17]
MSITEEFHPTPALKHRFLQTFLGGSKLRKLGKNPMLSATQEMILETGDHVRLIGHYSAHPKARGLVILLNGWLGDSGSAYITSTGKYLYQNGYSVFRLNYRDHGDSQHLNEGPFYATLLDEVFECVSQAASIEKGRPVFLAGFSLGGNFALRIARQCATTHIENLKHIISISPVLDPDKSTDAADGDRIIRTYFLKKWRKSLLKKQSLFPEKYDFSRILNNNRIRIITEELIKRYGPYENARQYFQAYSVKSDALMTIPVPTTIITAEDDPIIPAGDFHRLELNHLTKLVIHQHGGHNGFIEGFRLNTWYERNMVALFNEIVGTNL